MGKMFPLVVLLLHVSAVYSDSHSLRYYMTAVSAPGSGLPEYSEVGYVDDREIVNYNSESGGVKPNVKWMEKVDPGYWEHNTQNAKVNEAVFRYNVRTVMSRFNQTGGFHSFQLMYGCERRDDGGVTGYEQYGYDGGEFMSLDTQTGTYIPTMSEAQITAQRWNSREVQVGERNKNYLETECIDWLKKHVENGREDLERRVQPQVKVSGQKKGDTMMLHCQVYGFHPRAVHVKWMKNGDDVPDYETTRTLPNPDGTYQIRVSAEVIPKEGESYSCYVDHSSLGNEPLNVVWEPSNPSVWVTPVVVAVVVIILLAAAIGGFVLYRRKKADYTATSTSDTSSSDASANAAKA
ncbi:H-2 class I histocompatibility antigen, Q9 alpha chain-like isoform X2 [Bufo gargarizans]|uniref:H-2 class I histocompatibility antigen, Q9 alpha chain-like isoform X2 n=1 Tax=Bufo gargarizans TaxID=30331 RepID=UPI001CF2CF83|nr:H-2 class I histocompatibility antigen, Q9 alpha chain-like isoform X2 [Bufo gargarizans]